MFGSFDCVNLFPLFFFQFKVRVITKGQYEQLKKTIDEFRVDLVQEKRKMLFTQICFICLFFSFPIFFFLFLLFLNLNLFAFR